MLLLLLPCCATRPSPEYPRIDPCHVSRIPKIPSVDAQVCGEDKVCMEIAAAVELAMWIREQKRWNNEIAACPYVVVEDIVAE